MVYLTDPSIYAQSLSLTSSPADRYPLAVTLFLVGVLTVIVLLILGVVRNFRWVFWLMLVAFASSAFQIPVTLLQVTAVLPPSDPLWYSLFRMGGCVVELAGRLDDPHLSTRGVWAKGAKRNGR